MNVWLPRAMDGGVGLGSECSSDKQCSAAAMCSMGRCICSPERPLSGTLCSPLAASMGPAALGARIATCFLYGVAMLYSAYVVRRLAVFHLPFLFLPQCRTCMCTSSRVSPGTAAAICWQCGRTRRQWVRSLTLRRSVSCPRSCKLRDAEARLLGEWEVTATHGAQWAGPSSQSWARHAKSSRP